MKICKIEGCSKKYYSLGYCRNHYNKEIWNKNNLEKKRKSSREYYYRNHEKMKKRAIDNYYKNHEESKKKLLECYYRHRDKRLEKNRNPKIQRFKSDYYIRGKYGITLEIKENMIKSQDNKCAICQKQLGKNPSLIHLDHCHTTGKIRGILCKNCNNGLGLFLDNIKSLSAAIEYLNKFRQNS